MNNKNISSLLKITAVAFLLAACESNNNNKIFQLKGKIANSSGGFISLVDVNSSPAKTIDSVEINKHGEFVFIKKVSEKGFYNLQLSSSNYATIIADSTEKITFEGDATHLSEGCKISGSADSEILLINFDFVSIFFPPTITTIGLCGFFKILSKLLISSKIKRPRNEVKCSEIPVIEA